MYPHGKCTPLYPTPLKIPNEIFFQMFSKIDSNQTNLEKKLAVLEGNLQQQLSAWKVDIEKTLAKHTSDCDVKINDIAEFIEPRVIAVETNGENAERNARLNDIVVRGIPFIANENLLTIFEMLVAAIKFEYSTIAV